MKNVSFEPKQTVHVSEEVLLINGEKMGFVCLTDTKSDDSRFHVGINVKVKDEITTTLIQGFGPTKEEAVKETLLKATKYAENLSNAIAILKIDVGV